LQAALDAIVGRGWERSCRACPVVLVTSRARIPGLDMCSNVMGDAHWTAPEFLGKPSEP
jgi:hypothetical protein